MDPKTRQVADLYENYPFPHNQDLYDQLAPIYCLDELFLGLGARQEIKGARVLDVGCGTGEATLTCAYNFPEVEFVGVDLSHQSLESARALAERYQINNIVFNQADVMDTTTLPDGLFDAVTAHGSMMIITDPLQGLKNVVERLKPGGICAMSYYNIHGRRDWNRLSAAIRLLGGVANKQGIELARSLLDYFVDGATSFVGSPLHNKDTFITDSFLHPQVYDFDISTIDPFLVDAGLTPRRMLLNDDPRGLPHFPKNFPGQLKKRIRQMEQRPRDLFMEMLERPPLFHFFAQRGPATKPTLAADIAHHRPLLASFVKLEIHRQGGRTVVHKIHAPFQSKSISSSDWLFLEAAKGDQSCLELFSALDNQENEAEVISRVKQYAQDGWIYFLPPT